MAAKRSAKKPPARQEPEESRVGRIIQIRVTEEQKVLFEAAAARLGIGVSTWLKILGMQAGGGGSPPPVR
jgi:hypothetical protein